MDPHVPEPKPKSGNQDEPVEAQTVAKLVNPVLPPAILGDTAPLLGDPKPTGAGSASGHSTPGSSTTTGSIFSPGQMVAGRYRIVRFLAQGGMGEVYEVEDLELHEPAALKIVRPDIARDERMLERFIHEIRLARRVTHANVCRIFDVSHHTNESDQDVTFLTMELLRGETLSSRIRRGGRMSVTEALPLVRQMGGALSAAHDAGVAHLDFKSQNVMLVTSEKGPRAIVMDFGLARATALSDPAEGILGGSKLFAGTPATMAPEQVEGGQITIATDIYAFGVVLFQIVTGQLPFSGSTPVSIAVRRLKEPPPSPRELAPDLDPLWESVILRCLERDPGKRFPSVAEILETLGASTNGSSAQRALEARQREAQRHRLRRKRQLIALSLPVLLVLTSAAVYYSRPTKLEETVMPGNGSESRKIRRSIAILGFKNLSNRESTEWLSTALAEMFGTELAAGETLRVLPGEDIARMKLELALTEADGFSRDTLERVQKNLGTDLVMRGSYLALEDGEAAKLRLDLLVQDAANGETVASLTEAGKVSQLHDLVSRAGERLRAALPIGALPESGLESVRAALPKDAESIRLYSEGLEKLRSFEVLKARELLEQAVAGDPDHAPSRWALAEAWKRLGHDEAARAQFEQAFERSAALTREERLSIEASYRESRHEWGRAIAIYESLSTFFPDNLEDGLRLAAAQSASDKARDALATIERLRQLFPGAIEDPRLDLAESVAAQALADFGRQKTAAENAIAKASARGMHLLVAKAHLLIWQPLEFFGDAKGAISACEQAMRICAAASDRACVAAAQEGLGTVLSKQEGRAQSAQQALEEALAISREIGDNKGFSRTLRAMARAHWDRGDSARALEIFNQALGISREIRDGLGEAKCLENIGTLLQLQGQMQRAQETFEQALVLSRDIGYRAGIHNCLRGEAGILEQQGKLVEAQAKLDELMAHDRETGSPRAIAEASSYLGTLSAMQGALSKAQSQYEEGLKLFRELGDRAGEARMHYNLGMLMVEMGRLRDAEAHQETALEIFQKLEDHFREMWPRFELARISALRGEWAAARKTFQTISDTVRRDGDVESLSDVLAETGRTLRIEGDMERAAAAYREALQLRESAGRTVPAAEIRLALARLALESGQADAAAQEASTALKEFERSGSADQQALASAILARAYATQARPAEARAAVDSASILAASTERPLVRLTVALAEASVRAASDEPETRAAASQTLETVLDAATEAGLLDEQFQARLALGELELATGKTEAGRTRLTALRDDAKARGFGWMAQKAAALL